jgi:hypothetical protein
MRASLVLLSPLLALAACAPAAPPPSLPAALAPADQVRDPAIQVGQSVATFFRRPQPGQPAAAARAIAELEWLATSLPVSPQWQAIGGAGIAQLGQARNEARTALGIPRGAPSQPVIDGLSAAATALDAGDRAAASRALSRATFPLGPEATLARLAEPPRVPTALPALQALSVARTAGGDR